MNFLSPLLNQIFSSYTINKDTYMNIINNNINKISEKDLLNQFKKNNITINEIKMYINHNDKETSIIGILLLYANYETIFQRPLVEKFFYFNDINERTENKDMLWELNTYTNKIIFVSETTRQLLNDANKKILDNLNYIISNSYFKYIKNTDTETETQKTDKNKNLFYINSMFNLLCNIYDLNSDFYKIYFQYDWVKMYSKLFDMFIDFNNLPNVSLGDSGIKKDLKYFLTLFSLCMTKDIFYQQREYLFQNHWDFLYKVFVISTYLSGTCCCNHCFYKRTYSCQKAIDSIYKFFRYIENQKTIYLENEKKLKIKIADFLANKYGKNVCSVYLNKMIEICSNKDVVSYLVLEKNLYMQMVTKDREEVHHGIENLEKFIALSQDPKTFYYFFCEFTPQEIYNNIRISREIIKKLINPSTDLNMVKLVYEGKIFKNILNLISMDTYPSIRITEIEGIFDALLVVDNTNVIDVFYKNKFKVKEHFSKLIDNLLNNQFYDLNMGATFRIMIMFILLGEKIRQKYNIQNFYIEEFRTIYNRVNSIENEDAREFKKYF